MSEHGSASVQSAPVASTAEKIYHDLRQALLDAVTRHNAAGREVLELTDQQGQTEIYQEGLIFPSLRLSLRAAKNEIAYFRPARSPKEKPVEGVIVPGVGEHLLVIDGAGIAHRILQPDLARYLLRPALTRAIPR